MGTNETIGAYSIVTTNSNPPNPLTGSTSGISLRDQYGSAGTVSGAVEVADGNAWAEFEINGTTLASNVKVVIPASYDSVTGKYTIVFSQSVNTAFNLSLTLYNTAVATIGFNNFLVKNNNILINEMFDGGFDELWTDNNLGGSFVGNKAYSWSFEHDGSTTITKSLLVPLSTTVNLYNDNVWINHRTYGSAPMVFVATNGGALVWLRDREGNFSVSGSNINSVPSGFNGDVNAVGFYWYMQPY